MNCPSKECITLIMHKTLANDQSGITRVVITKILNTFLQKLIMRNRNIIFPISIVI